MSFRKPCHMAYSAFYHTWANSREQKKEVRVQTKENCCRFVNYIITKKVCALWLADRCVCMTVCKYGFDAVRVKGAMSLPNGMWHGLRNDIIMRNLIYGKWRKKINLTGKHACVSAASFLAPIWRSNRFAGPFITAFKARLKLKHSWYTK